MLNILSSECFSTKSLYDCAIKWRQSHRPRVNRCQENLMNEHLTVPIALSRVGGDCVHIKEYKRTIVSHILPVICKS